MKSNIPEIAAIRDDLLALGHAEMQELSKLSEVPFTTLWKIRDGTTTNPGIETIRRFYLHLGAKSPASNAASV